MVSEIWSPPSYSNTMRAMRILSRKKTKEASLKEINRMIETSIQMGLDTYNLKRTLIILEAYWEYEEASK